MLPDVGDNPEGGHQGGGGGDHHFPLPGILEQAGISLQRQGIGRLQGHEEQDEIWGVDPLLLLVIAVFQPVHMGLDRADQIPLLAFLLGFVICRQVALIGHQRHLGVDNQVPVFRQPDHSVGADLGA